MTTIIVILAIWMLLSLPISVILGRAMTPQRDEPELIGMEGEFAVFRKSDGTMRRVPLSERTAA